MDGTAPITTETLRALYGEMSDLVRRKSIDHLDRHCRAFIALSPFLVIGTAAADRTADVSPRGDAPGFVRVVDGRTLAIPDRPGNRRIDTLRNVAENPEIALIFFVPGVNETLRVNGRASITADAALLQGFAVQGKVPQTAMIVQVREAFLHCAKALIRSKLWEASAQVERSALPTLGAMIADQVAGVDVAEADTRIAAAYRNTLY
ncbi:MAG: pyridoxamine 5'-phosphate oxidase family protein [Alphaproteobacteria bacterium]|nr:pyridoxamine 5'-phosphate oxidase family protein [Alphaproteobacteria bacterium]